MAVNPIVAALIDPPYWGGLQDWIEYRADLLRSGLLGLAPFIREADENIERMRQADK